MIAQHTLNILVACEESQAECIAFRNLGHNAFSCDIQPCRKGGHPEWHIHADVTPLLQGVTQFETMDGQHHEMSHWDLMICHPPCTFLCKVGSQWLYHNPDMEYTYPDGTIHRVNSDRWAKMRDAQRFFMLCYNAKCKYVAVENPIPMVIAQLPKPSCYIDPSWFGVKYTKKTLYWLKNLPPIMPTVTHPFPKCFVTASRGKYRSRTFPLVAKAIAKQWADFIIDDMAKMHD